MLGLDRIQNDDQYIHGVNRVHQL